MNNNFNENELLRGVNFNNIAKDYITPDPIDTYYKATINDFQFQLLYRILGNTHELSILDSKGVNCIRLYFTKSIENNENDYEMLEEPLLSGLSYRQDCNIGSNLIRGEGTKAMIKAILIFFMKNFNEYNHIALMDDSHFECVLPNSSMKISIPLHIFSFIKDGKTYYQKYFGAIADDDKLKIKIQKSLELLNKNVDESFESIWYGRANNMKHQDWLRKIKEDVQELFEECKDKKSWMTLFKLLFDKDSEIVKKHRENVSCTLFYLLENFIIEKFNLLFLQRSEWIIERTTIENYKEYSTSLFEELKEPIIEKYKEDKIKRMHNFITHTVGGKRTQKHPKKLSYLPNFYSSIRSYYDTNHSRQTRTKNRKRKQTKKNKNSINPVI